MTTPAAPRPNVLWLMSDQHHAACMGHAGRAVRTPHLDRLAARGVHFTQAFCNNPICAPLRLSFITGQYPHTHCHLGNTGFEYPEPNPNTLPALARRHGYQTALVGKAHMIRAWDDEGFEHLRYCDLADGNRTDSLSPSPERVDLYSPADIDVPTSARDLVGRRFAGKPAVQRDHAAKHRGYRFVPADEAALRRHLAHYYTLITIIDEQIGRVIEHLRQTGDLDNRYDDPAYAAPRLRLTERILDHVLRYAKKTDAAADNFIIIVPSLDLVAVRIGHRHDAQQRQDAWPVLLEAIAAMPSQTDPREMREMREMREGVARAQAVTEPRGAFAVGTAVAGPGERAAGHLAVELPDGESVEIACWVLQGRAGGPVLYVHSTQHGNEISGIEVVRRVAQALDPRRLRGTLIAVPIANPLAFHWRRHHYLQEPEEAYQAHPEKDMAQAWPGDPAGTHPQRLAHALWHGAARHATHVLDLHTWNRWQAAATMVDAGHAPSLDLARAFGLWVQTRREPDRREPDRREPDRREPVPPETSTKRSLTRLALDHGKAACTPNFTGQWDIYEPEVRRGVAGLRSVLRHLGMWAARSEPERGPHRPPVEFSTDDLLNVSVPETGIFLPRVRPEQRVRQGQILGQLVRLSDFRAVPVLAPVDALVYLIGAITPEADVALPPMMPITQTNGRVARLLPLPPSAH